MANQKKPRELPTLDELFDHFPDFLEALVDEPDQLPDALTCAMRASAPYLLDVRTRGDVPMPRTGHWDIAEFLVAGND